MLNADSKLLGGLVTTDYKPKFGLIKITSFLVLTDNMKHIRSHGLSGGVMTQPYDSRALTMY